MGFYEEIAADYDSMTRFHERMDKETLMLQGWRARYGFRSALDVACGTGLHAIALARLGVRVTGADLSAAMLAQAQAHAAAFGVEIPWVQASMQELRPHVREKFDALFCLGNSLPHLLQQTDLAAACANFYDLLSPGGILVIQLLNYARILAAQERIAGVHRHGETIYVRFYDFAPERLLFNVLTIHCQAAACPYALSSTPLYPYRQGELAAQLARQAFTGLEYYGDMQFQPFAAETSANLVIVGRK